MEIASDSTSSSAGTPPPPSPTQGAARAYRGAAAEQIVHLTVAAGALLQYLPPHHLIPYAGSRMRQELDAEVDARGTLVLWDALSAGRLAHGERFRFDRLSLRTRIERAGVPEVLDGCELGPGGEPFGGDPYMATVTVLAPLELGRLADELHAGAPRLGEHARARRGHGSPDHATWFVPSTAGRSSAHGVWAGESAWCSAGAGRGGRYRWPRRWPFRPRSRPGRRSPIVT